MNLNQEPGKDFLKSKSGKTIAYLHREIAPIAPELLVEIDRTLRSGQKGAGNRESGFPITLEGAPPLFVRRSRRGGMMSFLGDLYIGFFPRMVQELNIISEARKRGVPAPDPMGAIVERAGFAMYRGAVITKAIPGMTMWEFVKIETDPRSMSHVTRMARHAIDVMHEQGLMHDDLNLHNLYVSMAGDGFSVVLLDFDKAKLQSKPLSPSQRKRNFRRLKSSIRKLDPQGKYLDNASLKIMTG
ncbi:MAG TPA: lipopolysaccharide kinase InaA family protein [Candidatus Binataceae bacterium]|nr:lipopolysaccharide kinase InaA family protein [Candidatus Binataceae bacterium]